jgi:hypothetical protein
MKRRYLVLFAGVVLLAGGGRVFAHHSFSAEYDSTQKIELEGVVTQFVWRNPQSFMKSDVPDKDGLTKSWALEWGSTGQLAQAQITRTSLKPGDRIVVTGEPARDPAAPRLLITIVKRPSDGWEWKGRVQ